MRSMIALRRIARHTAAQPLPLLRKLSPVCRLFVLIVVIVVMYGGFFFFKAESSARALKRQVSDDYFLMIVCEKMTLKMYVLQIATNGCKTRGRYVALIHNMPVEVISNATVRESFAARRARGRGRYVPYHRIASSLLVRVTPYDATDTRGRRVDRAAAVR